MKSKKASLRKIPIFLTSITSILSLALILLFAAHALAIVNLEVPIEMADLGLQSGTAGRNFARTSVFLDTNDYDGATYYFEIVGKNNGGTNELISLKEATGNTALVQISLVAGVDTVWVRKRSASFTPTTGKERYFVKVSATVATGDVKVLAARIIVQQTNATKTRIQIPLVQRGHSTAKAKAVDLNTTTSTIYTQPTPEFYSLWKKDASKYEDLSGTTPWTLEAVLINNTAAGVTYVALHNTNGDAVSGAEVSHTGTTYGYLEADFGDDALNFTNEDEFEIRMKSSAETNIAQLCGGGRLYVRLTNLSKAEVLYRVAKYNGATTAGGNIVGQRVLLDTSLFTSSAVYFEACGYCADNTERVFLRDHGTNDFGTGGSNVTGSGINFNFGDKVIRRTSEISPTSGNRFYTRIDASTNDLVLNHAWIVVKFADYIGGSLDVCKSGCPYSIIGNAIAAAGPGDTVTVTDSGTYNETVTMKDGVDVESATGVTPSITYATAYDTGVVVFTGPMTCNLTGFTIQYTGMGSGVFVDGSGAQVNTTIDNCTMLSGTSFGCGIRLKDAVSVTIKGCDIYRSTGGMRIGIGNSGFSGLKDRLASGSSVTIKNTTVGGSGQGVTQAGIRLRGSTSASNIQVTIGGSGVDDGNTISYNGRVGILLADIDQVSIENNDISNNGTSGAAGILLVDASTVNPHIKNNTIHHHSSAAGINIGGASSVTIGDNNDIYSNKTGIAFYVANNTNSLGGSMDPLTKTVSSQPVTITGNNIYSNTYAGIAVIDNVTGTITVNDNKIQQNTKAGIAIFNKCTAVITDNEIYTHTGAAGIFTGDWSGTYPQTGTGFDRSNGPANLTIKRNKVYGNRAGMRLDHASGTISNNLVYGNYRGGIRFSGNNVSPYAPFAGFWGITEIMNNTVADNGSYVEEFSENRGGGIVYDDISDTTGRNFYDRPVGATQDPITIKNNIVANNIKAGIKFCADNTGDNRSYNLFYGNVEGTCDTGGSVDCGRMCRGKTLGRCDAQDINCCDQDSWADFANFPGDWATGEICGQDPLFNADYSLKAGSLAIGTGSDNNDMGAYGGADPITW